MAKLDIGQWLGGIGLGRYAEAFASNAIDERVLPHLTSDDLKDIGVELVGHRRLILNAAADLSRSSASAEPGAELARARESAVDGLAAPSPETHRAHRDEERDQTAPAAERRLVTVLFCDMVGSTEIASRLDPEEYREVIAAFQDGCAAVVERLGGYVGQFLGDGLLAYFGYPQARENEAEWALRAGLSILEAVREIRIPGTEGLSARIGVATGLVVVGELLGEGRREPTAIGDIPNLAARFQQIAKAGELVCGGVTRRLAGGLFDYEDLGQHQIKGFPTLVPMWKVLGERVVESRFAAIRDPQERMIFGRSREIDLLLDRWATVREGEGQLVLIAGDPGIGKSCLVQEFLSRIEEDKHYRISFQCAPHYRDSALFPAVRQLEVSAGFQAGDERAIRREKLKRLLDEVPGTDRYLADLSALLSLSDDEETADLHPEGARRRILDALVGRIEIAQTYRAVVCLVEDAHWIDPSTQEMVTRLLERIVDRRVLVIVTYRPDFESPWASLPYATLLKLNRLSRSQSAAMIRSIIGDRPVPDSVIDEILSHVDGVPLYIEEVVKALVENGAFSHDLRPEAPTVKSRPVVVVPQSLHDTLLSRLDRDEAAKQVAQVASVVGRDFSWAVLSEVSDLPDERLRRGLTSLVESALVIRHPTASDEQYGFKHGLLHEATYNTLLVRRRQELHRRVAEVLESVFPERARQQPEVIARHLENGGLVDRAVHAWLRAGRQALASGAYLEAHSHLRAGLACIERLPDTPVKRGLELPLQIALAETLRSARFTGTDEALAACRRARTLCDPVNDPQTFVRVLRLEFGINFNRPDPVAVKKVADECLAVAEEQDNPVARVLGWQSLGCLAFFRGDPTHARMHLMEALAAADRVDAKADLAALQFPTTALSYLAYSEALLGRIKQAHATVQRTIEISQSISTFARSLALANTLIFAQLLDDRPLVAHCLAQLKPIAEARGVPYWISLIALHEGLASVEGGAVDEGVVAVRRAIQTFSASAIEIEIPFYLMLLGLRLAEAGRRKAALEILKEGLERAQRSGESWCVPELLRLKANITADEDPAAAEADLRQALASARMQGSILWQIRTSLSLLAIAPGRAAGRSALEVLKRSLDAVDCEGVECREIDAAREAVAAAAA